MYEYRVLALVSEDNLILKDVAGQRHVSAQGVGRLVERLRRRGFLKVERNPRDRREKIVTISVSGRAVLNRCHKAMESVLVAA